MPALSILCVTGGEPHAARFLQEMAILAGRCGAELVLAADGVRARENIDGMQIAARVLTVHSAGYLESVLDDALGSCAGDHILRLDDDERASPAMAQWLADGSYRAADHWKFSRAHLWPDETRHITSLPLWPDHQTRLSRRELAGGRRSIHAGSPYGGGQLAPVTIEHHKFLVRDEAQRRAIAARYDRILPGAGTSPGMQAFQLPDLAAAATAPHTGVDVGAAMDATFERMHQHRDEIEPFASWLATRAPQHVVEIGMLKGGTAELWHALASGLVVSVDLPGGRFGGADHGLGQDACEARNAALAARLPRFRGVLGDSHQEATRARVQAVLGGAQVDLLFVDGDHTYEGVLADYRMYAPLVRPGGIIAFHDILDTPLHRAAGCRVDRLWQELPGHKAVFAGGHGWGGIGVTFA
jgi:predicted O-methyltransferase YrrM